MLHGNRQIAILDAKYRDLWERPLPREMLYQLAIYAISHEQRSATILYPTLDSGATEARINVNDTVLGTRIAHVHLRPVLMPLLAELVDSPSTSTVIRKRKRFADSLLGWPPRTD
jgi:5-methylcytosine-specific restriction enzyme subunit McrC